MKSIILGIMFSALVVSITANPPRYADRDNNALAVADDPNNNGYDGDGKTKSGNSKNLILIKNINSISINY